MALSDVVMTSKMKTAAVSVCSRVGIEDVEDVEDDKEVVVSMGIGVVSGVGSGAARMVFDNL